MLFPTDCQMCKNYKGEEKEDGIIHCCSKWSLRVEEKDNDELTTFTFPIDCYKD